MQNENITIYEWKITKEMAKDFPIQYVLDSNDGAYTFELGDNEETRKLFEKYDYLAIDSRGSLSGMRGNTSFDLLVDVGEEGKLSDEDMIELSEKCALKCPECAEYAIRKDGKTYQRQGVKQRYQCRKCGYSFSQWYIEKY